MKSDLCLLLLDEPSMGLCTNAGDPGSSRLFDINAQGTTILLVEQNARMALDSSQSWLCTNWSGQVEGTATDLVV